MKNMLIRQGTVPAHSLYATAECLQIKDVNPSGLSTEYCGVESWLPCMCKYAEPVSPEKELYFYHPDHLGSSSWITGSDGQPTQYLAYLPFDEEFIDQQTSNWSAAYKFTGKEKDVETGYNYFRARYYMSDLGIWGSVDPLSDLYPSLTSYNYCANNPIMHVDPDGMKIGDVDEEAQKHINNLTDKKSKEYSRTFTRKFHRLEKSEKTYNLKMGNSDNLVAGTAGKVTPSEPGNDSYDIIFTVGETTRESNYLGGFGKYSVLFEEVYHATRLDKGIDIGTNM